MHLFILYTNLFVLVKGLSSFGQILLVCEYKHIMMLYGCVQSTIQLQAQPVVQVHLRGDMYFLMFMADCPQCVD